MSEMQEGVARCSSPPPPPVGEEEARAEGGGDGNCLSVPQGRRRPGRLRVSWIVGCVWLWWWRVVFARTDSGHRERSQGPRGEENWLSSEEPGKETKAEEKKGKKNDSRPLPMSLRGCLAEYEGGSGRLAGLGMGWDASSASRTASSSRNVNSTAGPDSVNYDALWPWKERGARALVRWGVLDASLFLSLSLSLSLRARLGRPPRAKMSWNSDQA
ncbi:hypothetical protein PCL_11502 [Purpureocillium lilacinum]|uniref:Uncharacterized protein n=1 Tax=Purpureocillium lilacinum TaxID=33203 RepID=A0A2U3EA82_PURLI|nr:hypothetical protein PCL_11502 [Purpureocillium lilacinum]